MSNSPIVIRIGPGETIEDARRKYHEACRERGVKPIHLSELGKHAYPLVEEVEWTEGTRR